MKRTTLFIIGVSAYFVCYAQTISINAQVVDEKLPEEIAQNLETKLQSALTINGCADNGYTERFVLTAKVDITQKDITPTTPTRISEKMDITLMVGDVVENKLYASVTLQAAGIGTNENKAFISAFRSIKGDNPKIQQMLNEAKEKIMDCVRQLKVLELQGPVDIGQVILEDAAGTGVPVIATASHM